MKKVVFLIIFSTFFFVSANAQFSFGVKGGLTVSDNNLDVLPDSVTDPIFGYNAGVFFKFGKGIFAFQPEILFVRKGTEINDKTSDYFRKYTMNYIDVPLLARFGFNFRVAELYFNMGPYVGYNFSTKLKERVFDAEQDAWITNDYDYEFDKEFTKEWDAGIVMGAGVRVLMIMLEVRYNQGLMQIGDPYFDSSNNKYVSVSLGVQF